jgi:2,5-dihydroxypyridine 5,6-dioxygenase
MLRDRVEHRWIEAFTQTFRMSAVKAGEIVTILSESQSRELNIHLSELALLELGARPVHVQIPSPAQSAPVPVRSTGASMALQKHPALMAALAASSLIIDCTVEGLLHARELPSILKSGARILMVSNEHPDALERLVPTAEMKDRVKEAVKQLRSAKTMTVQSAAGTDLIVDMTDMPAAGVWGFTDRPGTIAHWPGGVVVGFPKSNSVTGRLVMDAGDANLTFKRYLDSAVTMTIEDDFVTSIEGKGTDAELMRRYYEAWDDKNAYAISHVGWGMNEAARFEALTFYDQRDTNGTEVRASAGNFLFSTGANEFAGRFTEGHFDLPMRGCTIKLDGVAVVEEGKLV